MAESLKLIRYPGGKQRYISQLSEFLPEKDDINGTYIEPFVGGGSTFFFVRPETAVLSDINAELITLYRGIKKNPKKVWEYYSTFPSSKDGYYKIRDGSTHKQSLEYRAARILYLNRTCFKGMWRHNSNGDFNIGYGGQDRRWAITEDVLMDASKMLENASLHTKDFEHIIDKTTAGDFIFLDPPYKPNSTQLINAHYSFGAFTMEDYKRLAKSLNQATDRNVKWTMTISSHPKITKLFKNVQIIPFIRGTGPLPGIMEQNPGEVIITNMKEEN